MKTYQFCDVMPVSPVEWLVTYPPFLIAVAVLLIAAIVTVVLVVRAKKKKSKAAEAAAEAVAGETATEKSETEE